MTDRLRGIKSFVLRQGRLTPGQTRALELLWPKYGRRIDEGTSAAPHPFTGTKPTHLEIGFGMGDSFAEQARQNPLVNYVGVEVHRPGVGHMLMLIEEFGLDNVCVYCEDSIELLTKVVPDACLDVVQVFFPDPWPKKKHHKRRIISRDFMHLLEKKLKPGGLIHVATDWQAYADEIQILFSTLSQFSEVAAPPRPQTKFERRGLKLGHSISDMAYSLVG